MLGDVCRLKYPYSLVKPIRYTFVLGAPIGIDEEPIHSVVTDQSRYNEVMIVTMNRLDESARCSFADGPYR